MLDGYIYDKYGKRIPNENLYIKFNENNEKTYKSNNFLVKLIRKDKKGKYDYFIQVFDHEGKEISNQQIVKKTIDNLYFEFRVDANKDFICYRTPDYSWRVINYKGELLYDTKPVTWWDFGDYRNGLIKVSSYGKNNLLNHLGRPMLVKDVDYLTETKFGYNFIKDKVLGTIDKKGIISNLHEQIESFETNEAPTKLLFKQKNKWGIMDTEGKNLIAPKYDSICKLQNGFARVAIKENRNFKWGFINSDEKKLSHVFLTLPKIFLKVLQL